MQWGLAEEMVKLFLELEYSIFWKKDVGVKVSVASWLCWHVYLKHHHPMEGGRVLRCHARQKNTKHNFYWLSCIWGLTLCIFISQIVFCRTYCYEKFCKIKVMCGPMMLENTSFCPLLEGHRENQCSEKHCSNDNLSSMTESQSYFIIACFYISHCKNITVEHT